MKADWYTWLITTGIAAILAGVGGTFTMMAYVHGNFITVREKQDIIIWLERIDNKLSELIDSARK